MVLWHDDDDDTTPPVAVEFSFKYGSDEEDYQGSVTRDAFDVLDTLFRKLPDWVHPNPTTKTAFAKSFQLFFRRISTFKPHPREPMRWRRSTRATSPSS